MGLRNKRNALYEALTSANETQAEEINEQIAAIDTALEDGDVFEFVVSGLEEDFPDGDPGEKAFLERLADFIERIVKLLIEVLPKIMEMFPA